MSWRHHEYKRFYTTDHSNKRYIKWPISSSYWSSPNSNTMWMTIKWYTHQCIDSLLGVINLTHWGRVTHICVSKLTIIGSDNGLSPDRRQAIIWTKAGILLIEHLGTKFSEISIGIQIFSFKKMRLKMSSAKWRPFCLGLNVLSYCPGATRCGRRGEYERHSFIALASLSTFKIKNIWERPLK